MKRKETDKVLGTATTDPLAVSRMKLMRFHPMEERFGSQSTSPWLCMLLALMGTASLIGKHPTAPDNEKKGG